MKNVLVLIVEHLAVSPLEQQQMKLVARAEMPIDFGDSADLCAHALIGIVQDFKRFKDQLDAFQQQTEGQADVSGDGSARPAGGGADAPTDQAAPEGDAQSEASGGDPVGSDLPESVGDSTSPPSPIPSLPPEAPQAGPPRPVVEETS